MAKTPNDDAAAEKRALIEAIGNNELTLGQAVRRMRNITGMSQIWTRAIQPLRH